MRAFYSYQRWLCEWSRLRQQPCIHCRIATLRQQQCRLQSLLGDLWVTANTPFRYRENRKKQCEYETITVKPAQQNPGTQSISVVAVKVRRHRAACLKGHVLAVWASTPQSFWLSANGHFIAFDGFSTFYLYRKESGIWAWQHDKVQYIIQLRTMFWWVAFCSIMFYHVLGASWLFFSNRMKPTIELLGFDMVWYRLETLESTRNFSLMDALVPGIQGIDIQGRNFLWRSPGRNPRWFHEQKMKRYETIPYRVVHACNKIWLTAWYTDCGLMLKLIVSNPSFIKFLQYIMFLLHGGLPSSCVASTHPRPLRDRWITRSQATVSFFNRQNWGYRKPSHEALCLQLGELQRRIALPVPLEGNCL